MCPLGRQSHLDEEIMQPLKKVITIYFGPSRKALEQHKPPH